MGQGSSTPGAIEKLPDPVTRKAASEFLGKCFTDEIWVPLSKGEDQCDKDMFVKAIELRNHAPSLRAWLEFWRIDELEEVLKSLDVMTTSDLWLLEDKEIGKIGLKTVHWAHWEKAVAHSRYLDAIDFDYPPSPLYLWLESWRLQRLHKGLFDLGVDVKDDIIDLSESDAQQNLGFKLLELRRWTKARASLQGNLKSFDFSASRDNAVPTLDTWLESLMLEEMKEPLAMLGAYELSDLADIDDRELASLQMNKLQTKHYMMGLAQVEQAKKLASLDGHADDATWRGWLESWRLLRLQTVMEEMGAYTRQDLIDLEPNEYSLLKMRPLEAKRFEGAMIAVEEEFNP
eukprot:CAMPEP_0172653438 /NCGR_PEP_ID=MMETSP1068-20121228/243818_1 /TAXON_ID=35684 /ORGANISM="Pseudopedinella elastica, Strain CCMP716" /LENGTH=344 /DNA_ID=CAMNT_0013467873 /DNA_START=546 /DNA_END=1580 /DNA_ORIENTATION=+